MLKEISLRIMLQNPVDGTMDGLQKGKGPNYGTVQAQLGNGPDLTFDFTVSVKEANGASLPTLAGPFVQGPAGNRFIYITIGHYAGQTGALWSGRMKVLSEATFQNALFDEGNSFWSCTVAGRNEVGKPVLATVKPFGG
jgi:hypothetical protein